MAAAAGGCVRGRRRFAMTRGVARKWSGRDSNPRPLACKASALPIELPPRPERIGGVTRAGFAGCD